MMWGERRGYDRGVFAGCSAAVGVLLAAALIGCGRADDSAADRNDLTTMEQARISIGEHAFEVWLARDPDERQYGLMQVTSDQLAPIEEETGQGLPDVHRGMLFIFEFEQPLSFWMRNTITPLDIAYIRGDGRIVSVHTMAPLETRSYPSGEPALMALEVLAGTFEACGIAPGDHVEIPDSILKQKALTDDSPPGDAS